jgi:hypothetical protein
MTVLITLTTPGTDTTVFDLYSNLDGYVTPFAVNIPKASLVAGYTSTVVPDYTTIVRVQAKGVCVNHVDIPLTRLIYTHGLYSDDTSCAEACDGYDLTRRTEFFNLI